jgi:signal transduction histidine kinase/streptogramin lyase
MEKRLLRVHARSIGELGGVARTLHPEVHHSSKTPEAGRVFAMLLDRERNVWVGTDMGLHRFSRSNVVRGSIPRCFQYGFTAAGFAAGDNGTLWLACGAPDGAEVVEIRDGEVVSAQRSESFSVAYRDAEGTVWFAGEKSLAHLDRGKLVSSEFPPQVRGRPIAALVREPNGAMWVSVTRRSLFRFHDGAWIEYGGLTGLPRDWPIVTTIDGNGVLWFGYSKSRLARVDGTDVRVFDAAQGLEVGNVLSILAQQGEVWIGGELGLARLDGMRFTAMRSDGNVPFQGISGIVRTRNGDLWLNGIGGIMRIGADEIEAQARSASHSLKSEVFNHLDGVYGMAVQLRPQPSAIETSDGRVWFSMTGGFVSVDATQLLRNTLPPPVTIWSLSSDSRRYPNHGADIQLPVNTTELQFEYSAGSLTVPERVRFRYMLEGSDRRWHEAGGRREARYTNLGPGRYVFRVTASNNDGVWNTAGASMAFSIAPAFYQTTWFSALCGLAFLFALVAMHRLRLRQVAAQVRGKLEARLSERERIARELHDTLLQGIQGLIWRFQAATDRIPPDEPARKLMEQSLDRADQLLGESRDRVKDLRPTIAETRELSDVIAAEGEVLSKLHPAKFHVSVQGTGRDLHPIAREEILMIGREALSNAFAHAKAERVEVDLMYEEAQLRLRIRDDGQGISVTVLEAGGRPGHFGLMGMRERAQKLGATLEVWSKPGAGTEVDLRVPAKVAYGHAKVLMAGAA